MTPNTIEEIARVCHEVNRAYSRALGDTSHKSWDQAPEWQRESARLGVELHLTNQGVGPRGSHESWMKQKIADGWVYGLTKNETLKQHPCLMDFDLLPREQQAKDYIFHAIVHVLNRGVVP